MNRRGFIKATGVVLAGQALCGLPVAIPGNLAFAAAAPERPLAAVSVRPNAAPLIAEPGLYQISGLVRLEEPLVEISGVGHKQAISWSGAESDAAPLVSFVAYERYDRAGVRPSLTVAGGRVEALSAVLLD